MQCKLAVPARVAVALPLLLVMAGCGASEPPGPQLSCSDVYQKVRQMARQLDSDDSAISGLMSQIPLGDRSEKYTQMCARMKIFVQQKKEVLKLIRDNKDRCKESDFSGFGIGAISLERRTDSESAIEIGSCK